MSWNAKTSLKRSWPISHAPRERVSWNALADWYWTGVVVTLHVSVWVEIVSPRYTDFYLMVTLHVSVWVEIHCKIMVSALSTVTLHVSVWVEISIRAWAAVRVWSRSTWACELKLTEFMEKALKRLVTLHVSVWVEIRLRRKLIRTWFSHAPCERVSQFSFQRRTYRYWIIQITAWLRSGGIFIPKYYTFFMCFSSNPPIHTPKFVQTIDL